MKQLKYGVYSSGIYHKAQIDLTYHSNHRKASYLTHDQTRYILERTSGAEKRSGQGGILDTEKGKYSFIEMIGADIKYKDVKCEQFAYTHLRSGIMCLAYMKFKAEKL